ncbi:neutral amino acid NAAT transporter SnatA [Thermococcus sp. M39]|uniref:neutral amino acid NAAT transporter SnatA n=1 Tax=Thermococcus sp. M39 TaxID=1638262 RepID=UPI00143BE90C|nr:neutral amino acid NAAT transporter SnatA [Thermococcus sp. M39]NJE08783.1 neutral amino acid NAAT transporter SnatA [Thermococcus sp. M39]
MIVLKHLLYAYAALFAITNPIGAVPVFLSVTHGISLRDRVRIAKKVIITVFLTLVIFAVIGEWIFSFFGSSVDAFSIAGGILLFRMALDMLSGQISKVKISEEEAEEITLEDIAIIPLAIPLISGPGAITTVMLYMAKSPTVVEKSMVLLAVLLVSITTYLILLSADKVEKKLGKVGIKVLTRMMGLILASIAVQMVINGIKGAFNL